ncbi:hypothetical protein ABWK57_13945 [Streptomyces sp. NPDC094045]|uniref:hypothetical protein n=1 Tax=unclassified Streptomyces TaxID=2593676 RepID=UPI0033933C86
MSRMKKYAEDARDVQVAAGLAAGHGTARDRLAAITVVFEQCGDLARSYHTPHIVAGMLVHRAAEAFGQAVRAHRLVVAA